MLTTTTPVSRPSIESRSRPNSSRDTHISNAVSAASAKPCHRGWVACPTATKTVASAVIPEPASSALVRPPPMAMAHRQIHSARTIVDGSSTHTVHPAQDSIASAATHGRSNSA